jgi:hypothetical protein
MSAKRLRVALTALFAAFALAQLVPVSRENPPVESEVPSSPEARALLVRACFDCHSNETVWLVQPDRAARGCSRRTSARARGAQLRPGRYDAKRPSSSASRSTRCAREMPMRIYTFAHPDARLAAEDIATSSASLRAGRRPRR